MARTIRRTPVVSNIPSNPRYEHLNILDFKGLSISENPLTQDPSSASDLLNLYVDINGVLTTRPRTEKYLPLIPDDANELINMYPLEDGVLVQGIANNVLSLWVYSEENEGIKEVDIGEMELTDKKLSVFEKDSKIYILAGDNYYYIKTEESDYVLKDVYNDEDTYIPTTHIGYVVPDNQVFNIEENDVLVNNNIVKRPNEPRNILTNKYKEKYFWNAYINYDKVFEGRQYTNGYLKYNNSEYQAIEGDISKPPIRKLFQSTDGAVIVIYSTHVARVDMTTGREIIFERDNDNDFVIDVSGDGKKVLLVTYDDISDELDGFKIVDIISDSSTVITLPVGYKEDVIMSTAFSESGNEIYINFRSNDDAKISIHHYNVAASTWFKSFEKSSPLGDYIDKIMVNTTFSEMAFIMSVSHGAEYRLTKVKNAKTSPNITMDSVKINVDLYGMSMNFETDFVHNAELTKMAFSVDGSIYSLDTSGTSEIPFDVYGLNLYPYTGNNTLTIRLKFDDSGGRLLMSVSSDYGTSKKYFLIKKFEDGDFYIVKNYEIALSTLGGFYSDETLPLGDNNMYYICEYELNDPDEQYLSKEGFIYIEDDNSPKIEVEYEYEDDITFNIDNFIRFKNNYWFYGDSNRIYYTNYNDPTYIPENNYNDFGEEFNRITGLNLASYDILLVYKKNRFWIVFEDDSGLLRFNESKADNGNVPIGAQIITPLSESVVHINDEGFYAVRQLENIQSSDRSAINISLQIAPKFSREIIDNMISTNYIYWTFFAIPEKNKTKIYVLDDRTGEWYYWEINKKITNMWVADNELFFSSDDWWVYSLQTSDIRFTVDDLPIDFDDSFELYEYFDDGREVINWKWTSQIMNMKTINYIKQLMTTSFIVADNEDKDSYGLNYKFKVFRKLASETADFTIEDRLDYVANVTKKTHISRFNFLQMELSNIPGSLDHNKLKLIGLAFKYRYLEGSV